MPGIENSDGGRVTRSLRKRLTSVDTDSSRPGTPVLPSLQSLQEEVSVTPSKRTTRRTSMSTPVPTPSKGKNRLDVVEAVNSPARRSTRRRSLSTHEQEEPTVHPKSKEPAFDVVEEEDTAERSPERKSKAGNRISPRLVSRPRSQTPITETTHKSPEVSPQVLKHMKHSKVMLKKEYIDDVKNSVSTKAKKQEEAKESPKEKSPKKTGNKQISSEKERTPIRASKTSPKSADRASLNTSKHNTPPKKGVDESPKESTLTENETTLSASETSLQKPVRKVGRPRKIKNVGFNNTADEEGEKSVFPKTPGLTKSKSYILDSSKPDGDQSINKSECKLEDSHEESETDAMKDAVEDDNEIGSTKTPYKLKLNSVESSTPIHSTSAKKKDKEEVPQKDVSNSERTGPKEDFVFPKSWSHSVSGTVNDLVKIDSIESEESAKKKLDEEKVIKESLNSSKSKKKRHPVRIVDSDDEEVEEDDMLTGDEEENEEREREKSMFIDDEAMEVAEGEESMDSEERAYLEEHEIPVYAESIGSEDTIEEECEEEGDEEDAAFVVSDTEEIAQEESDSDDEKEEGKKYKRIIRHIDSSDEESNSGKGKDDDFCLIIDSSIEGSTSGKEKSHKDVKSEGGVSMGEKSIKSIESKEDEKSLKAKEEEVDGVSDEENNKELKKSQIENVEVSDGEISKKERKSLKNRKSVEADKDSKFSAQEGNSEVHVAEDVPETSEANEVNKSMEHDVEDKETEQKDTSLKKERKSLLSLTNRKSLATPEKSSAELNEEKPVDSPLRRKSLKRQEEQQVEGNEMETEDQDTDTDTLTSKLSKKERKSLNKSEVGENKGIRLKGNSFQGDDEPEEVANEIETEGQTVETPSKLSKKDRKSLKKKSLLQPEEQEVDTEDKDTEDNTDIEATTCELLKKQRKSLNDTGVAEIRNSPLKRKSIQKGDEKVKAASPNEMETEGQPETPSKLLKKERKSLKYLADDNKNSPVCSPLKKKSLLQPEEHQVQDGSSNEMETEDKDTEDKDTEDNTDIESTTFKLSKKERKSLNKSGITEIKNSPLKRKSIQRDDESVKAASINDMEAEGQPETPSKLSKKERKSLKFLADDNKNSPVCSPLKKKSLLQPEEHQVRGGSSNEMETEDKDTEDKDTEDNTDIEAPTYKLSKQERMSLSKSEIGQIKNSPLRRKSTQKQEDNPVNDSGDDEMETENQEGASATLSKKERKSLMSQAADDTSNLVCSPFKRKSLKKQEEGLPEEAHDIETGTIIEASTSKLAKNEEWASLNKSMPDENQNSFMCSPFKQKSLTTMGSPNKSSFQMKLNTPNKAELQNSGRKISNKESKSLVAQELFDQDSTDVEMSADRKSTGSDKATRTPTKENSKSTRVSLNKSDLENNSEEESDKDVASKSSIAEYDEDAKLSPNASPRKVEFNSDKDGKAQKNTSLESNEVCAPKSPTGKNRSPLEQMRMSCGKGANAKGLNDESEQSDDSSNEDQSDYGEENKLIDILKKSVTSFKNKKNSLNGSSHNDAGQNHHERSLNKSKLERSALFVEDDASDEAETTSAFESSRVSEDKSRNSSKISRKSLNQSIYSSKMSEKSASPGKTTKTSPIPNADSDSDDEGENAEDQVADGDRNEENGSDMSKVMEFLGEEESGHNSSPNLNSTRRKSLNKSKLDETFHLESNNNSVLSALHRSLLKKSHKQAKALSESMKKAKKQCDDEEDSGDVTDAEFSAEEEVEIVKKVLPDKGLSVSLSGIEKKKKSKDAQEQIHKSFTIGVSLRNTAQNSSQKDHSVSSPDPGESSSNDSLSEKEDLQKIEDVQVAGPYKPRNSLSKICAKGVEGSPLKTKSKRYSMYVSGEGASQSFVENLGEEKKKLHSKRSRKSNSFSGATAPLDGPEEAESQQPESRKSKTQPGDALKSDAKTDIQRILSRCDEILEAANQAKREAKLNAKKTKVRKPKWMDNEEKVKEEEEVKIPLVSKKEIKRKEKMKKELAKAIKHSTAMLKTIDPKLVKKLKAPEVTSSSKRLPADFLDELEEPKPKKTKTKDVQSTPPSDKENSKKTFNKAEPHPEAAIHREKKKKKQNKEIIETAAGTVIVEPATPSKLKFQNGFRESPKTPVGFKIQDIDDNRDKSKKGAKKLFAASEMFEGKESSHSKTSDKKSKKRKLHIEEPVYTLPKTQWTSSGVFIEEDVRTVHHPLANSTATQFMVSSLGESKKSKSKPISSATMSVALNFKNNAFFSNKVKREPARNLIYRKERSLANNRY